LKDTILSKRRNEWHAWYGIALRTWFGWFAIFANVIPKKDFL
jgi:hypothetical protein